ncbi:MAG: cytidylate kinase-like family protein [bacterium]|nr:cytidylate kinase-like family protein [bacterium]
MKNYVITISRGYGSGGRTIGKMLAKELGISFYDRELLRLASDDSGINEELFAKADETVKSSLLYKVARKAYKGELIPPDQEDFISNDNLFNYQAKIIKELAATEPCVIVGRCADYVLQDVENVIRVFVHAPLLSCVDRLEEMYGEDRKDLEKKILSIDKKRAVYYKYYTGQDWNNAMNYDLCVNTSTMSFEQGVEMIKAFMKIKLG